MNLKEYPKAVVLKKGLIGIALLVFTLIIFLILHNLYASSKVQINKQNESDQKIQALASQTDVNWYENPTTRTIPTRASNQIKQQPTLVASPAQPIASDNGVTQQAQQELQKAMSAPITSNQLTATAQPSQMGNISVPSGMSMQNGASSKQDADQNMQAEKRAFVQTSNQTDSDYLGERLKNPISPYVVQAGTSIPGIMVDGVNSDLPGQLTGQVKSNVYDSISGKYLLIPQGSRLIGVYDSQVAYGQDRVLVVWQRIIFPNGQSINLEGMPGVDMSGYAGFNDQVNNHYMKILGSVILMSSLSVGAQLSQPQNNNNPFGAPTIGQTLAQSLGTNISNVGTAIVSKSLNIQPTLEIRQGYLFNVKVKKDIVFPGPYNG